MKYASTKTYVGQRASIGRPVVLKTAVGLGVGLIDLIGDDEKVWLCEVANFADGTRDDLTFCLTQTAEEIEAMPVGCWTWPVRV